MTLLIGTFAMFCATALVFLHYDLPWDAEDPLELPEIYMVGVWLSILLAIGYIGVYTWQIAEFLTGAGSVARSPEGPSRLCALDGQGSGTKASGPRRLSFKPTANCFCLPTL